MTKNAPGDVTQLLLEWSNGNSEAFNKLMPLVYDELRRIARRKFYELGVGGVLQPTALVHEAYIKLIDETRVQWRDRGHFYAIAANTIRRILVDDYRRRTAIKRGGQQARQVPISEADAQPRVQELDFTALNKALDELEALEQQQARIIELRFFGGLSHDHIAQSLGVSRSTVEREWRAAKAWLHARLTNR